ncbi:hypothetical protein [Streptomyces sp. bgisy082]|uniref:hypothetical protein n=1 Tax=Streptomyces sp. bgisy082 TaxID=3413776 RepID=UPI003D759381
MGAMDLAGIAALCALAGIPVTLMVARLQKRTALEQAEAAYRTALAQAEAGHRAAMEAAQASHRSALELAEGAHRNALEKAQHQAEFEWEMRRWDSRRAVYEQFQQAVDQVRRLVFSEADVLPETRETIYVIHELQHLVHMVAAPDAYSAAVTLYRSGIASFPYGSMREYRVRKWNEEIAPLRAALDEAIRRDLETPFPRRPQQSVD